MTEFVAVIGSGYGDEGKGLLVDALVVPLNTRVVRFNGGAQAAHTVVTPTGERRVFSHVGAGALRGAATHLSRFFTVNPIMAVPEIPALQQLDLGNLWITVDPRAPVSTPIDMMLNQATEEARRNTRHGSCGLGVGETIERTERHGAFTVADLAANPARHLARIAHEWKPARCAELGLDPGSLPYTPAIDEAFLDDCGTLLRTITLRTGANLAERTDRVIFEGAQGLGLDQDLGAFPHVTRSHTGLPNVAVLMEPFADASVKVVYVTRCYATRHGAGPLPGEQAWTGPTPADPTNTPNPWQGELRFAPLDCAQRQRWIRTDLARATRGNWQPGLCRHRPRPSLQRDQHPPHSRPHRRTHRSPADLHQLRSTRQHVRFMNN